MSTQLQPIATHATFSNDLQQIYAMHMFVREVAIAAGFSNVALGDIELAVVEACANVIKHAYRKAPKNTARIDLSVTYDWGALTLTITDWGEPFVPPASPLPAPDVAGMVKDKKWGGMGLFFIQQLMDEVAWDIRPGVWNRLKMVKRLV